MTSRQQKKVRYVKCPKCARILQEPDHVPLYTCGGCDTTLQAKYYTRNKEALVPTLPKQDEVPSIINGHTSDVGESCGPSLRSSGEQSLVQNEESNKKANDDCCSEQIGDKICGQQTPLSVEHSVVEIKGGNQFLVSQEESGEASHGDKIAEQLPMENGTRDNDSHQSLYDGIEVDKQNDEHIGEVDNTCGVFTKEEIEVLGNRQSQQVPMVNEMKQDQIDKQEECEEITALEKRKVGDESPAKEDSTTILSQPTEKPLQFQPVSVEGGGNSENETKRMEIDSELCVERVSGSEINCISEDKPVEIAKIDKNKKNGKEQKSFIERMREKLASVTISNDAPISTQVGDRNEDTLLGTYASHSASAPSGSSERTYLPQDPDCDISFSDDVGDTSRQKIENIEITASDEPLNKAETSEPVDMHEKAGNLVEEVSRSPAKRSPAYDGSVSSCDGIDDRVPGQPEHLNEGPFSENDVPSRRVNHGNSRTRGEFKSFSCQLSDEKPKRSTVRENDIQGHHRTIQARDGLFPPRIPFQRKSSEMAFETGSSSHYLLDEGPNAPNHFTRDHPYRYVDQEPWPRKTYGGRGYMEGRRFPEASWRENDFHPPLYYNDETSGELYQKERYYGHNDRRRRAESLSLSGNLPRTRYSGEVYNGNYVHRPHDDRPWSAQLPSHPLRAPPASYYRHGPMPYMDPFREASRDPYDPYLPTNPSRYLEYDPYGWSHEALYLSDDQRHKEWMTKRSYMREKRQAVKRHLRPLAGGAPFIACRFCFKVLQLPEEFLISKRKRSHRLKCAVCSNVLEYSLTNGTCLASQFPYAGESDGPTLDRDARSASPSQHNSCRAPGEEKSKLDTSNSRTRERLSDSSDGASPSDQSKQGAVTWKLPSRSKSPLHRLMGYPSPKDLLTEHTVEDE